jgi:hypothetical protein
MAHAKSMLATVAEAAWAFGTSMSAQDVVEGRRGRSLLSCRASSAVGRYDGATDAYIASAEPPPSLSRLLSEGQDELLRALRCQERNRQAG